MKRREPINLKQVNYIGPSMNPIFKAGDRLHVISYNQEEIRVGDVIVFISPEDGSKVVHRIVSIDSDGIKTRGDNCDQLDPWLLRPDQILGRVVSGQRGNKQFRVFGGRMGELCGASIRALNAIDWRLSSSLRPFYNRLAKSGLIRRKLPNLMKTQVIFLNRGEATELQLLMGRRVIGRWLPKRRGWHIRRPYRLFVDEETLPENPAKRSVVRGQSSVVDDV